MCEGGLHWSPNQVAGGVRYIGKDNRMDAIAHLYALGTGILGVLIGAFVSHRLTLSRGKAARRREVLDDVIGKYRDSAESYMSAGVHGLIKAGISPYYDKATIINSANS